MFADDTLVYVSGSCEELEMKLNVILNTVENWMNANKLKMNASKIKYMVIRSVRKKLRRNIMLKV